MSQQRVPDDPLKEPTNARARLRQQRQQASAAAYEATYYRRVLGREAVGLSSARHGGVSVEHIHCNCLTTPQHHQQHHVDPSTLATTSAAAAAAAAPPTMEGRKVNTYGQTLDGPTTAIHRLLHGDFYCTRGRQVVELVAKPEGKHMRFRAASHPPSMDIPPAAKDAETMTRPIRSQQHQNRNGGAVSTNTSPTRKHHSVHNAHQRTQQHATSTATCEDDEDASWGVYSPQRHQRVATASERDRRDRATEMAALDLNDIFRDTRRPQTRQHVSPYRRPTMSSTRKSASAEESRLARQSANEAAVKRHQQHQEQQEALHRQHLAADAYETTLSLQKTHPPGHAAVVSEDELRKIMNIVNRPSESRAPELKARHTTGLRTAQTKRDYNIIS